MNKYKMIASMLIFGTLGIFVTFIPLPSSLIALSRSVLGTISLAAVILFGRGKKVDLSHIKKNALLLLLSGIALGFNWILLFESYARTGVNVGTVCYYMAPVFTVLLSPLLLKEKVGARKLVFTALAVVGAVLISGIGTDSAADPTGIVMGLSAALLYSSIVIMNRKMKGLSPMETTFSQLGISAIVMLVYVLFTVDLSNIRLTLTPALLLIAVGVIHTGLAYALFFGAANKLPAQTTSLLSYIDPALAIILSALILHQDMSFLQIVGTVMILGSTLICEWLESRNK